MSNAVRVQDHGAQLRQLPGHQALAASNSSYKANDDNGVLWIVNAAPRSSGFQRFLIQPSSALGPVGAGLDVNLQGNRQLSDPRHFIIDEHGQAFDFFGGDFEDQFVMYLQQHPCSQLFALHPTVDRDHGKLDKIRRRSLNDRVYSDALR